MINMTRRDKIRELGLVLWAWLRGQGDLAGLVLAWLEVTTGMVPTGG